MTNENNQFDFDVLPHPEGWGFLPVQGVELWYRHRKRGRTPSYFCYSSGIGDETPNFPPDKGG